MARKTLKGSGLGGADAGSSRVAFLIFLVFFCAFGAFVISQIRAEGGADSDASTLFDIAGRVPAVILGFMAVVGLVLALWAASSRRVMVGLQAWATRNGWEVTDDMLLAAHWAARFHFSADALTTPLVAARGWVRGRDAMILFCMGGTDKDPRRTIIVVDADADFPVTAVVPRGSASADSHAYGNAFELESIEFDRRWCVMGSDAAGSHAVFTPRVIARLLEPMPGGQPEIVWDGPGIRGEDAGFIGDPMHVESRLLLLADLAGLTPAYQVTHTNDDPSLRPAPPPMLRIPGAAFVLIALGATLWFVGPGLFPAASGRWAIPAIVVIGLALVILGVRLATLSRARVMSEWRAAQSAPLGPPPTERLPPGP